MNLDLPEEAVEFGRVAAASFDRLGGVDVVRRAEVDGAVRTAVVAPALAQLGIDQLDCREDLNVACAGAELCRAAGRVVLPYPLVSVLLADPVDRQPFSVVPDHRLRVNHGDLFSRWRVTTLSGPAATAERGGDPLRSKLGPFVSDLRPMTGDPGRASEGEGVGDVALFLTLSAWRVLGAAERALDLAVDHVATRVQFGQTLASFQAVQFQLADAAVGVDGLRELCRYTLWRLFADPQAGLVDSLALRLHALEVARAVIRTAQQLHGAAGLCDEYDVSIICRHIQPDLRLPFGQERTAEEMMTAAGTAGFESLFPHGGK